MFRKRSKDIQEIIDLIVENPLKRLKKDNKEFQKLETEKEVKEVINKMLYKCQKMEQTLEMCPTSEEDEEKGISFENDDEIDSTDVDYLEPDSFNINEPIVFNSDLYCPHGIILNYFHYFFR